MQETKLDKVKMCLRIPFTKIDRFLIYIIPVLEFLNFIVFIHRKFTGRRSWNLDISE